MDALENLTYDELEVGDTATYTKSLTEDQIILFAAMSGDVNPVHLDQDYAENTIFKGRVAHGMWSGALISAAIATVMPGPGSIYLEQSMKFRRPVKIHDTLTVNLKVEEKQTKNRVLISCKVCNQNNEVVLEGDARIIAPTEKMSMTKPSLPRITIGDPDHQD
ncbi:MaoC/PaaZ C-terminal domain-containing protein [Allohahella sp. A8]|uniref:MaoC/PaaZ C-terminal domain-containing protein n=1 Tax=Allohahella sp. A8 TaxID=3141461 RepID=UPI000C0B7A2A|nr:3-hydroxybutyryl-CoA dehydratase [Hahellaceae bacterium]|tara:strand:- start:16102 stop:16590 length:489 start_codon:yes stop_codon:yes gene_type:complete